MFQGLERWPFWLPCAMCQKTGGDSLSKQDFCCVDNFSVMIPYRELEKLLEVANKMQYFQDRLHRTEEQLLALRVMYTEALEKIAEINRYL